MRGRARRRGPRRGTIIFALVAGLTVSASVAQAVYSVESGVGSDLGISDPEAAEGVALDAASLAATPVPGTVSQAPTVEATATSVTGETVIAETSKQKLTEVSTDGANDIPAAALIAYKRAAMAIEKSDPSCHLDWSILAGIGRVESNHGRYGGSQVFADGSTSPHIVGLALNGEGNVASIKDTDGGRLDGDTTWDRAVGPMQFIPSTWAVVGTDADGDGIRDPHDIDDAALAAGVYLCASDRDLSTEAGKRAAIFSYNHSEEYVALVLSLARQYASGASVVPNTTGIAPVTPPIAPVSNPTTPDTTPDTRPGEVQPEKPEKPEKPAVEGTVVKPKPETKPKPHKPTPVVTDPEPTVPEPTDPEPTDPEPTDPGPGSPEPTKPTAPGTTVLTGVLAQAGEGWQIGDTAVTFGDLAAIREDYDGDGTPESVQDELAGLLGKPVEVQVGKDDVVVVLQGLGLED